MDPSGERNPIPKGIPMNDLIARYLDCWNEADPVARRKLIDEVCAADVEYTDPLAAVRGTAEIDATIAAAQQQFPGAVIRQLGPVDAHHRQARFRWGLGPAGADPLAEGIDVVVFDEADRVATVLCFFDKVPS